MSRLSRRRVLAAAATGTLVAPALAGTRSTPRQTAGPFYPVHEPTELDADLTHIAGASGQAVGEVIWVQGRVVGTDGKPLTGVTVDVWQANHHGKYIHPNDTNPAPLDPNFQGWAKITTDAAGSYRFKTIKPGAYPLTAFAQSGQRPRHIHFKLTHSHAKTLVTQMYFPNDPLIRGDIVMSDTPKGERTRLIARETIDKATGLAEYAFDIVLDTA